MRNSKKYQISESFQQAIKTFCQEKNIHAYKFAADLDVSPTLVSLITTERMLFDPDDPRIERIAKAVEFDGSCFEFQTEDQRLS